MNRKQHLRQALKHLAGRLHSPRPPVGREPATAWETVMLERIRVLPACIARIQDQQQWFICLMVGMVAGELLDRLIQ